MDADLKKLWDQTLTIIKAEMSEVSFNTWIKSCEPISISNDTIRISVPNSFTQDILEKRYKDLVGKTVILPIMNKEIPIIADEFVEKEFGTGAVKLTPAHDPNDYQAALKHNLEIIPVFDEEFKMNNLVPEYKGMDMYEAREKIVERLQKEGYLVKIEDYTHNVGKCYRCHHTIEPHISEQWFVKMEELAKPAIEAVKNGEIKFIPKKYEKLYFNWMENIQESYTYLNPKIMEYALKYFHNHCLAMTEILDEVINQIAKPEDYEIKKDYLSKCLDATSYSDFKSQFELYLKNTIGFKKTIDKVDYSKYQTSFKEHETRIVENLFDEAFYLKYIQSHKDLVDTLFELTNKVKLYFQLEKKKMEEEKYA